MIKVLNISICKQNKQLNVLLNSALLPESFISTREREWERKIGKTMGKRRKIRNNKHKDYIFELIYNQFALHLRRLSFEIQGKDGKCRTRRWCRVREKGKICIQTCVSNFKPPFNLKFMTCIAKNSTNSKKRERERRKKRVLNGMITNSNVVPGRTRAKNIIIDVHLTDWRWLKHVHSLQHEKRNLCFAVFISNLFSLARLHHAWNK